MVLTIDINLTDVSVNMKFENLLNITKAAQYIGVTRPTFYNVIKKFNLMPAAKIGQMSLFDIRDLNKIKEKLK